MYTINMKGEALISLPTLAEVIYYMNEARPDGNPFLQNFAETTVFSDGVCIAPALRQRFNHIAPVLDGLGNPKQVLMNMLKEVTPYARPSRDYIRLPEQMTRRQWGAIHAIGSVAYNVIPCFSDQSLATVPDLVSSIHHEFYQLFEYGHNGPAYHRNETNSRHEVHVAYALARGKHVPSEVLADYEDGKFMPAFDLGFFGAVVRHPYLRGAFPNVETLAIVLSLARKEFELSEEKLHEVKAALVGVCDPTSRVQVEDRLYARGILKPLQLPPARDPGEIGQPIDDIAYDLRTLMAERRRRHALSRLKEETQRRGIAQREVDYEKAMADRLLSQEPYGWANKVAQAFIDKDLTFLLSVLENSGNDVSQRVAEKHFRVKLRRVNAAERRRAILAIAGFVTEEQQAEIEAKLKAVADRQAEERRAEDAQARRKQLQTALNSRKFIYEGHSMTGDVLLQTLIARGFTTIKKVRRGCVPQYHLCNGDRSIKLQGSPGMREYAEILLADLPVPG